jgi:serine/threonine protein kinase
VDEADIWFKLNHVNVVKMNGGCDSASPLLVCERAGGGQLDGFLAKYRKPRKENPSLVWYSLLNAALGLQYLHRVGIVHGDLKLNNI